MVSGCDVDGDADVSENGEAVLDNIGSISLGHTVPGLARVGVGPCAGSDELCTTEDVL